MQGIKCRKRVRCSTPVPTNSLCSNDADCPTDFLCDSRQNACVANPVLENSLTVKAKWYHDVGGQVFTWIQQRFPSRFPT